MASQQMSRLAIIGCGAVVEYRMIEALRRIGWLPTVLVDTAPKQLDVIAAKMGRKGGSVLKTSNWQSVVSEFDAAIVALPPALHSTIGTAIAEAGKHIFMEKPLAITGSECRAMTAAADRKGVKLSVGLIRRYLHIARWTKALLNSKILGEITRFKALEGSVFNWDISSDALLRPNMAGGGVLMDTGAHTVDLLLWWLGDIELLSYRDDGESGVEADCVFDGRLASGAIGSLELSRTRNLRNAIRIEGTKGFIEAHLRENRVLAGSPNALAFKHDGIGALNMPPQPHLFDAELADFRKSVLGGGRVGVSGHEGTKSVEFIDSCYRARQSLSLSWTKASPEISDGLRTPIAKFPFASKILVTGATGFIGDRLVERLVRENGAQVRCLVRNLGRAARLARLPVEIMQADLSDPNAVDRAVTGMDYVFHCAYDRKSRDQNTKGLRNLIAIGGLRGVRRLVHVSSFGVYEPFPDGPLTEKTRDGDRSSPYVSTKLDLEQIVFDSAGRSGAPVTIVQPTIVYGPFSKTWTNAPAEMLIHGNLILPDHGEGLCNAVYVDDVVDGLMLAAISPPAAVGERFIISGPQPVTWATFYTEIARALGTNPPSYWPREKISKENQGILREIRLGFSDPSRLIKLIVRWNPAREVLRACLAAMPAPLRTSVMSYYERAGRRLGQNYLPHAQALALYCSKASASCEKAHSILGYKPRFDFPSGMVVTGAYLKWAYEDEVQSVAAIRNTPKQSRSQAITDAASVQ